MGNIKNKPHHPVDTIHKLLPVVMPYVKISGFVAAFSIIGITAFFWALRPEKYQNFTLTEQSEQYSEEITASSLRPQQSTVVVPPSKKQNIEKEPEFSARAVIALDVASEAVLFSKNEQDQLWPASTTKVMTALVALKLYSLDDVITVSGPVSSGSSMGLVQGEQITVENLLYGLLIQSANDAAFALASYAPGGLDEFVGRMNQEAADLGLTNTHFVDPAGFDNEKQFTTATDLARLSLVALKNKTIAKMVAIPLITISDVDYVHFHTLRNVNQLLGSVPGVAGVKTGFTENAKENLINMTKRNGGEVLTVILGSDDRFGETMLLTNWAFTNYHWPK